jgi:cardiolipin synthase
VFVEEHLQQLRRERYSPRALLRYAHRLARLVKRELEANPGAVRSVWSLSLGFFAAAFVVAAALAVGYERALAYEFFLDTAVAVLVSFGAVTLGIGRLRDREGYRLSSVNVPIALTLARLTLLPGLALFLMDRHYTLALVTFVIAALTDVADGWVARRWNQVTQLGTVLDPLVDIVFNAALFASLTLAGLLSPWVLALAALRYGILLVGAACLYLFVGPVRIRPTASGRFTGVVVSSLVAFLILLAAVGGRPGEALAPLTRDALAVLLGACVVQVVVIGWWNLRSMRAAAAVPEAAVLEPDLQPAGRVVGDVRWGRE